MLKEWKQLSLPLHRQQCWAKESCFVISNGIIVKVRIYCFGHITSSSTNSIALNRDDKYKNLSTDSRSSKEQAIEQKRYIL